MKFPARSVLFALLAVFSRAQPPRESGEPAVQLPPLVVEDTRKGAAARPWFYAEAPGFEVLSHCSESTTALFTHSYDRALHNLQVLVPLPLQVKMSCPEMLLLYRSDMVRQLPTELTAELRRLNPERPAGFFQVKVVPNLSLHDVDITATYTVIDEFSFDGDAMRLAPETVRRRLEERTPALPRWFIEGIMDLYPLARFNSSGLTLPPMGWVTPAETKALRLDRDHPRSLLPLGEFFKTRQASEVAPDTLASPWRHQAMLFVRWAFDGKKRSRQDAFFKFVAQASEHPVTEAMFQECFGFDFADGYDRLRDYLPQAVATPLPIAADKAAKRLSLDVHAASRGEIARIKGEWERLSVSYIRKHYPLLTNRYLEQSRTTLLRTYEEGERDPGLLAAIALSYCDSGEEKEARPFLESALQAGAVRPRALFELARLRYKEALMPPAAVRFSPTAVEVMLQPLKLLREQSPPLAGSYDLLARILLQADRAPNSDELAWVTEGAQLFPSNPLLTYLAAQIHLRYGSKATAESLIERGRENVGDETVRKQFEELSAALARRAE